MNPNDFEPQEFWIVRVHTENHKYIPANLDLEEKLHIFKTRKRARKVVCGWNKGKLFSTIPAQAVLISKHAHDRLVWEAKQYRSVVENSEYIYATWEQYLKFLESHKGD